MESSSPRDLDVDTRLRREEVIADLARRALDEDLEGVLEAATDAVAGTLGCEYCGAFETGPDGSTAVLRAAAGAPSALVDEATVDLGGSSAVGEALAADGPVVDDGPAGERLADAGGELFDDPEIAARAVVRVGPAGDPWGVLAAYATGADTLDEADGDFLARVGDVLGSAVENATPGDGASPTEAVGTDLEEVYGRISDAFFALDEEWRFTFVNDQAHEVINPEGRDLEGEYVWDAFPAATERKFKPQYERAMYEQETVSFEEHYPEPLDAWFEVRAYPSESGLSVYFRDVTERKERERELQRFETLFKESTDVNAVLNPDGTFQYLPPSVQNVLGYEAEELLGENTFDYVHPDDRERIAAEFQRVVEDPDYQPTEEFRYRHGDGSWIWLEASGRNLLDDEHIEGIVAYTRDVTERKQRARELRRKERRFEAVFEDPNILVGLLEPDGTVLDINHTAMDYIDADLDEVTGEPFWETPWWGGGDDVQDDVREWTERAADGEYVEFEADLTRPDGDRYVLDGVFRPVTDEDGDVVSIIVSDRDVTDRRIYERQLEESEQRYRTLAEHFPNGIVTLFDDDLRYTLAAGQAFEYLPVSPDEVEDRTVRETWGDDVADVLEPLLESALDGEAGSVELSYVGRDWLVYAVPIADEDGNVFTGMTMAQDVTERKEYERKLEESERRYRTLAEHFPNGAVGVFDADLRYTLAEGTKLGEDLPPASELEGSRMPDLFPEHTAADLEPVFRAAVEDGETTSTTTRFGGRHWRVWATPLRDGDGGTFAGLSFAQDVTDQIEREQRLERYETIVETVNDGVYVVDADGYFTMVNEAYAEMLGYPRSELVGMHVSTVVDNAALEGVQELQASMEDGEIDEPSMEAELRTASGGTFPAEATFALLPEDDDDWHRVGVVRDVSDRLERERKLAESERRYRTLVENFPDGAVAMFDEAMEYTVVGGQLLSSVSVEADERIGNSVYDIYPDGIVAEIEPHFEAVFDGESRDFEVEFHDRNLSAHTLPVRNAGGEIFAGMLVVQDVTERREYERELQARARQQQAVAELGQYALEADDLDELMDEAATRVAEVLDNDYCKVLDLDADSRELLLRQGVGWQEGIVGSATVGADEDDSQAGYTLRSEEPVVVEDLATETRFGGPELLTDHGVRSGISTIIGSIDDPWGILGTHDTEARTFSDEDVNFVQSVANILAEAIERHQYQAELEELVADLEESNERLEQFAYAASHDLQEPLRMVSSYLQLVETRYADQLDDDAEEFIDFAVDGAERMREMIEALLAYSRVETRGDPFEPVDLDDVLADVREDLQVKIEETDATLTAESLPTVEGDRGQLRQVLQNLLDNALEYSGDEPPEVHVGADRTGGRWVVSVADEGIGIDPEDTETVFEVFQRLHSREQYAGTGIGLALCERIVERHGGDIWVESEPGEGSTFYFTLPAGDGDA